jgi:DNA-binding MarR family transcriptional regulator
MPGRSAEDAAREVWSQMGDLVLDHGRRREVVDATGLSFGKTRALRRIARRPMSLKELAAALGVDPPNATVVVDDLESLGLVVRGPHPTDRRIKLVELTADGRALAAKADLILSTPPPSLAALPAEDLASLRRILGQLADA